MEFKMISDEEIYEKLIEFRRRIEADGRLPDDIEKVLLLRYLKFFNGNIERALKRLTSGMELRKYYSNIFHNRDTLDSKFQNVIHQVEMILLPKLTVENYRIILTRLIDYNPDNVVFEEVLTVSSMLSDINVISYDNAKENKLADGEILIYDLNGLTPKHLTKLGISSMRGFFRYMIEAHPMRVKQIHLVNSSSLLDKIVMLIRPFIGSNAMKVMHFHMPDSTTLFDFLPREILPKELGGTDETLENVKQYWIKRTEEHRSFLLDDSKWTIKECDIDEGLTADDSFAYMGFC